MSNHTPEEIEVVRKAAQKCSTRTAIAKSTGMTYLRVCEIVEEHKIALFDRDAALIARAQEELVLNPRATYKEIAASLDVPYMMLYLLLRRTGTLLPINKRASRDTAKRITEMAGQGLSLSEIATRLGLSKQFIHELKKKYDIEIRDGRRGDEEERYAKMEDLFQRGFSANAVHKKTGFSKNYVYRYAQQRENK